MANAFKQIQLGSDRYIAYGFESTPLNPFTVGVQGAGLMSSLSDLQDWRDAFNSWCNQISGKELVRQLYSKIPNGGTYQLKDRSATIVATVSFTTTSGLKQYYCTYEWNRQGRYNFQSSATGYPAYVGTYTAGVKFRVISSGNASNVDTSSCVTITRGNTSVTKRIIGVTLGVDDVAWFDESSSVSWLELPGSLSALGSSNIMGKESHIILFGEDTRNSGRKLAILEYDGNYTQSPYYNPFTITGEIDISDVTNVEPEPQPEVGYMNEIDERFSPRIKSNSTGAYIIDPNDVNNFTYELVTINPAEIITNVIFNTTGEYILGFRWYYGLKDVIDNIASTKTHNVNIGGGHLGGSDEGYKAKYCTTEFVEWHTSEMSVMPYFDNYLDLMCTYELYLPYYGFLSIDPNDIVGGTIQVYYNINIITGFANINVVCKTTRTNNNKVKSYSVNTQVGLDIPFGKDILKTMFTSWAQTCSKAFATGASIGSVGAFQEYSQLLDHNNKMIGELNEMGGDAKMDDIQNKLMGKGDYVKSNIKATAKYGATKIPNALEAHPISPVTRNNSSSNENGSLDELYPYLLITRPMIAYPSGDAYEKYVGLPSYASARLSAVHGFTQIAAVKPENLTNAPKYLNEIISLLQAGVYL